MAYMRKNNYIEAGDGILAGVSGGADSVCLLLLLHRLQEEIPFTLAAAHVNHGIRGESAGRDQKFVEELCAGLGIPCYVETQNVPALAAMWHKSEEEAGREVRYRFFKRLCREHGFQKAAVAHNRDDNMETVLHNLFRGTGIDGMTGIPSDRPGLIRPLLPFSRVQIETYLKQRNQSFCTDESNADLHYTRNKIRNLVMPAVRQINARAEEHILEFGSQAAEIADYLNRQSRSALLRYTGQPAPILPGREEESGTVLLTEPLRQEHPVIQKRVIREWIFRLAGQAKDISAVHVELVLELWEKQTGRQVSLPYRLTARRSYDGIVLEKTSDQAAEDPKIETVGQEEIRIPDLSDGRPFVCDLHGNRFILQIKCEKIQNLPQKMYTKWLDYDKIERPLAIRYPCKNDYLVINEAGDRKKLRRYLIDEKIPAEERACLPVLADGSHILWVIGHRISAYYRITKETHRVLEVQWKKEQER